MGSFFRFELLENIPALAWLMRVSKTGEIIVKHGRLVECKDDFFVSGVWAGDFEKGDFVSTKCACCSGARFTNKNELVVSTPSHLQESIFSHKEEGSLVISNSLPFLLVETNNDLDADYLGYEADFCSIIFGERELINHTILEGGGRIDFHRNCNIFIARDLSLCKESKNLFPHFNNYFEYYNYLNETLSDIVQNATNFKRKYCYGMISTISRGYDAAAVSALVHGHGCKEVLTMRCPADDNGKSIAKRLGFSQVYEIERDEYRKNRVLLEAEVAASGQVGGMIFEPYEELCAGKLIFMGTRGDSIWERMQKNVNREHAFPFNGYAQASLSPVEHLLRINSIVVHVPLIGAESWPNIADISNSDEMRAWSIGDRYDRPIARRILEDKGVAREDFGQFKQGAGISFHFNTWRSLQQKMSPNSYEQLKQFKKCLKHNRLKEFLYKISFVISEFPVYFNYIMNRMSVHCYLDEQYKGHKSSPTINLLVLWGINEMKKRYL